jgi:5-methylcytosine-specific restriction endonuclease McrA
MTQPSPAESSPLERTSGRSERVEDDSTMDGSAVERTREPSEVVASAAKGKRESSAASRFAPKPSTESAPERMNERLTADGSTPERTSDVLVSEGSAPARIATSRLQHERPRAHRRDDKSNRTPSRHVPAAVRRMIWARDGGCCTFSDASGRRCGEQSGLEIHHEYAFALGGPTSSENLRLLCRPHNALRAERDFGQAHMECMKNGGRPK